MGERLTREDWKNPDSMMWKKVDNLPIPDTIKKSVRDVIEKLARYEDAEENLLKETRKVGIREYLKSAYGLEIGQRVYEVYDLGGGKRFPQSVWEIEEHVLKLEDLEKLGETVFARREDAEAKVQEMETESLAEKTEERGR